MRVRPFNVVISIILGILVGLMIAIRKLSDQQQQLRVQVLTLAESLKTPVSLVGQVNLEGAVEPVVAPDEAPVQEPATDDAQDGSPVEESVIPESAEVPVDSSMEQID